VPVARAELAPAKVNLTLDVIGRRPDGYHEIESLVAFAAVGDTLTFTSARGLSLVVRGPTATASGEITDNLVFKAARQLSNRVADLKLGRFILSKRLPVAAGLGGGSADAAAALRLLARANRLALDDSRVLAAARVTGADVPVCLDPRPRLMRGIGDVLSDPLDLPRFPAVLVNPGVAVPTKDVFQALRLNPAKNAGTQTPSPLVGEGWGSGVFSANKHGVIPTANLSPQERGERTAAFLQTILAGRNDLEAPAIALQPVIADVLSDLRALGGCRLARMSGSGGTCFGIFESGRAATTAARSLRTKHPQWWVRATTLA
jgi:4-diphosphocytidyl-2-C-methyl-D-erythritol kinase